MNQNEIYKSELNSVKAVIGESLLKQNPLLNTGLSTNPYASYECYQKTGTPKCTISNIEKFLRESKKINLKYNEYNECIEFNGRMFTDEDLALIRRDGEDFLKFDAVSKLRDAITNVAMENKYNPAQDYFNSLHWDGVNRLDNVFIDYLYVDDKALVKSMTRKWFIACVKRTFEPGSKFDNMIILQGAQGLGKTELCVRITKPFGCINTVPSWKTKNPDSIRALKKSTIIVNDELNTFRKSEMDDIKTFLSTTEFTFTDKYERFEKTHKIHCVFIGTTNEEVFLRDTSSTSERRFWIMKCHGVTNGQDVKAFTLDKNTVDQIWAEAYYSYKNDPEQKLNLTVDEYREMAEDQQEFKTSNEDEFYDILDEAFNKEYVVDQFGMFEDFNDFLNQFNSYVRKPGELRKIDFIPMSYVNQLEISLYKKKMHSGQRIMNERGINTYFKGTKYEVKGKNIHNQKVKCLFVHR